MNQKSYPRMHTSLFVEDLEATVKFYQTFFDQEVAKVRPGYAKFESENPGLTISFIESKGKAQSGFGHMGIQVDSLLDLKARFDKVKAAGLKTVEEEGVACCYAMQDKFWVEDPDGYQWEVYYFHQDSEWNDPRYTMSKEGVDSHDKPQLLAKVVTEGSTKSDSDHIPCC